MVLDKPRESEDEWISIKESEIWDLREEARTYLDFELQ
jgi:hypothetical protein